MTRMVLYGSGVGIWRMMLRKCVVSLTQEGMRESRGFKVVFNVFGEVVGGAVAARDDWATWNIRFV